MTGTRRVVASTRWCVFAWARAGRMTPARYDVLRRTLRRTLLLLLRTLLRSSSSSSSVRIGANSAQCSSGQSGVGVRRDCDDCDTVSR